MGIIKNKLNKATDKLVLMEALEKLNKDLRALGPIPKGIKIYDYSVNFFNLVASFQESNSVDINAFKKASDEVEALWRHLATYRYNHIRAKRGERITLNNLYFGNYDLSFNTAAFWKDQPEKDVQAIIQHQISGLIEKHREPMIELITTILSRNKKPDNFIIKKIRQNRTK